MTVLFALLSALSNATASMCQHLANVTAPPGKVSPWRHVRYLLTQPTWLLGTAFLVLTFVCGAVALFFGQLAIVQPLFVTELVFTLALRRLWLRDHIAGRTWVAASTLSLGLVAFLVVADPQPGTRLPSPTHWAVTLSTWSLAALALLLLGSRGSPERRAVMLGAAAGVVWSVDAGFVKAATNIIKASGWASLVTHWPLYAVVATGVLGEVVVQAALHVGPLSASQPAILIVEPLAGILVGVQLFGERLASTPAAIAGECIALAVMALGVIFTSRWAPPHMTPRRDALLR